MSVSPRYKPTEPNEAHKPESPKPDEKSMVQHGSIAVARLSHTVNLQTILSPQQNYKQKQNGHDGSQKHGLGVVKVIQPFLLLPTAFVLISFFLVSYFFPSAVARIMSLLPEKN